METSDYNQTIKDAVLKLIRSNTTLYHSLIDIATQGELKEWSRSVPVGEVHQFEFVLFKNCEDANIKLLVEVIEKIDTTVSSLINLNALKLEENDITRI